MLKITDVLHKEMTRKEFLATLGFGIATLAGLSAMLRMMGKDNPWTRQTTNVGYGGGSYGGQRRT
jgi:Trp operon repressor